MQTQMDAIKMRTDEAAECISDIENKQQNNIKIYM